MEQLFYHQLIRYLANRQLLQAVESVGKETEERQQAQKVQSVQFQISLAVGASEKLYDGAKIYAEVAGFGSSAGASAPLSS